jgi:(+)-trans-carveol dehydrogenase
MDEWRFAAMVGPSGAGRLDGKVALVTGAARGQGRSHTFRLARDGANIIAVDTTAAIKELPYPQATADDLTETVAAVRDIGRRAVALDVDVRDEQLLSREVAQAVGSLGRLDIVCANAGIGGYPATPHELEVAIWQQMIDINLTGVWNTCRATIPHILAGNAGGSIVLTSSVFGLRGARNMVHYVTAKHGVVGMMRSLALEYGQHGIRVNSVHPSQVSTPMIMNDTTYLLFQEGVGEPDPAAFLAVSQDMHVLPVAVLEPEDISNAVAFLVSDEARYITGVALPIDAGALLE